MEVTSTAEKRYSWWKAGRALGVGIGVSAVSVAPALVFPPYARFVTTVIVVSAYGVAGYLVVIAVLGSRRPPDPPDTGDDRPTVSIVVTAYDEADVLPWTLDALSELAYPTDKLEVLVCYESASADGTAEIARRRARTTSFVTALERSDPPAGKAAVTNFGVKEATGEIIGVLDADQQIAPDAVRRAVGWFRDDDVWCVTGRRYGRNPTSSLVALHATVEHHLAERLAFFARQITGGFTLFTGGQAFFRKEVFETLGPFAEDVLLEDVEMASRIHRRGKWVHVDPGLVTTEVNPETVGAWWHQRIRWARGGLQVGRRHLMALLRTPATSLPTKVEALATFGPLFAVPLLALAAPVVLLAPLGVPVSPYLPDEAIYGLVGSIVLASLVPAAVFLIDARDGYRHESREYLVSFTLWMYMSIQVAVLVTAFLDEFVRSKPATYVTT